MNIQTMKKGVGFIPVVIAIAIIIAVAGIGLALQKKTVSEKAQRGAGEMTAKATPVPKETIGTTSASDTTDAGLDADLSGIDANLKTLKSDDANIDAGLNDKM